MLCEIPDLIQIPGERRRRWFASDYFDLIVWFDDGDGADARAVGFHLHYDRGRDERVFMWDEGRPLRHHDVDDGTRGGRMKMTALVTSVSVGGDAGAVAARFEREAAGIEPALAALVLEQLRAA
jgi:hypothetical protein